MRFKNRYLLLELVWKVGAHALIMRHSTKAAPCVSLQAEHRTVCYYCQVKAGLCYQRFPGGCAAASATSWKASAGSLAAGRAGGLYAAAAGAAGTLPRQRGGLLRRPWAGPGAGVAAGQVLQRAHRPLRGALQPRAAPPGPACRYRQLACFCASHQGLPAQETCVVKSVQKPRASYPALSVQACRAAKSA